MRFALLVKYKIMQFAFFSAAKMPYALRLKIEKKFSAITVLRDKIARIRQRCGRIARKLLWPW